MMLAFQKIVERRIKEAQERGDFDNLPGHGQPIHLEDDSHIPEDLRLVYKILKNADCLPPEVEIKKEILTTEALLAGMTDVQLRCRTLKKLNFLIMKLNAARNGAVAFEVPQKYESSLVERLACAGTGRTPDEKQCP